ncbi:MAG: hypothetical protein JKY20_05540 [Alphaproteobacteria bacterium]|nr:hypothetical protein [Alphaproteobacteria bacterium]
MMRFALIILVGFVMSSPAGAENQTYRDLFYNYDKGGSRDKRLVQKRLADIGAGLHWANTALETSKAKRLYCPPAKLVLRGDMYFTMLRRRVEQDPALLDSPDSDKGRILLLELQKTFRCK